MFEDLYDEISRLWSWRWPAAEGRVVLSEIERVQHRFENRDRVRLSVVYSFSIGEDGPYGGEDFWRPAFTLHQLDKLRKAKQELHRGKPVLVRYRRDDPSINKLDRSVWKQL